MIESWVQSLVAWFALPSHGLSTVFVVSFVSATLLPLGSEPAVFGYAKLNPEQFWLVVAVATVGNTLAAPSTTGSVAARSGRSQGTARRTT